MRQLVDSFTSENDQNDVKNTDNRHGQLLLGWYIPDGKKIGFDVINNVKKTKNVTVKQKSKEQIFNIDVKEQNDLTVDALDILEQRESVLFKR